MPRIAKERPDDMDVFFMANRTLSDVGSYAQRHIDSPAYLLALPGELDNLDDRYKAQGLVLLGFSHFVGGGRPEKSEAIEYARQIGADHVVYALFSEQGQFTHYIAFYAAADHPLPEDPAFR